MSPARIALLGAIAGFTIYLGLPIGRLRRPAPRARALLNSGAVGVLLFLLWDVLAHAWEPVDGALSGKDYGPATVDGLVLGVGLTIGLVGLVYFDRWMSASRTPADRGGAFGSAPDVAPSGSGPDVPPSGSGPDAASPGAGPGATATAVVATLAPSRTAAHGLRHSEAGRLALMIAAGIGLHNFAEGLAIGNSAAGGELALAVLLIIGFGLHNATEGFGIVAPLAAAGIRPSWQQLGLLGLIGGGPTLLGTLVGQSFTNDLVSIAFLAVAAGSILFVVIELLAVGRKMAAKHVTTWGLLAGLLLGFVTDAIVTAAGA